MGSIKTFKCDGGCDNKCVVTMVFDNKALSKCMFTGNDEPWIEVPTSVDTPMDGLDRALAAPLNVVNCR